MSLGGAVDAGLAPGPVRAEQEGAVAEVDVEDVDRLGVRVRSLRVTGARPVGVQAHAERLPEALRALHERVVPVEVAPELGGAVLRTEPGEVRDREFFEVHTDGHEVRVGRLRVAEGSRTATGFTLTREQLRRLVDGLGESFGR